MAFRFGKKTDMRSVPVAKKANEVINRARKPVTRAISKRVDAIFLKNQTTSPLLQLPRELRDIIYEYAIGGNEFKPPDPARKDSTMYKGGPHDFEGGTEDDWPQTFSLSRVCRQLHAETRLLPYSLNVFQFTYNGHFGKFLPPLKEEYKKAITMLFFGFINSHRSYLPPDYFSIQDELEMCSNLKLVILRDGLVYPERNEVKEFVRRRELALVDEGDPLAPRFVRH